jgi:tetratricopeptide (TPR) repeat protein
VVALALAALVAGVFAQALRNQFLNYDDDVYVTGSAQVRRGLTAEGLRWALTSLDAANWFPLTRVSHMADMTLFGLDPRGHHLTSVALHAANTALLFLVLRAFTGALWAPALAAALFGVHPLHVEPVAWLSERKELVAFFFGVLTLGAYRAYAARPGAWRMAGVAALFAAALAGKAVVVTLPFVLLLLDLWPLGRVRRAAAARSLGRLALEKAPLFALAAVGCLLALRAQQRVGATVMRVAPLLARAANAAVSYARYLGKTLWPAELSFFYPYPEGSWPAWAVGGSLALLAAVSWAAWRERARRPWLGVGWLWYLGTFVPMIGLVQVGWQAMADRYTYLPLVGVFVAAACAAAELGARGRARAAAVAATGVLVLAALAVRSSAQVAVWRDSRSVYAHAAALDPDNWLARQNLGTVLCDAGEFDAALPHLLAAVRLRPQHANAWYNLGGAYYGRREYAAAIAAYERSVALDPHVPDAWGNLGASYLSAGQLEKSLAASEKALGVNPRHAAALQNRDTAARLLKARARR